MLKYDALVTLCITGREPDGKGENHFILVCLFGAKHMLQKQRTKGNRGDCADWLLHPRCSFGPWSCGCVARIKATQMVSAFR